MQTFEISLSDAVEEFGNKESELEATIEELREQTAEVERGSEEAAKLEDDFDAAKGRLKEVRGKLRTFRRLRNEWSGEVFVCKELSYGELMRARDETGEESYDISQAGVEGYPREGYYKLVVLRLSLERVPEGAPDDPKDFPMHLGEYLYERVDEANTRGTLEGNEEIGGLWED